MPGANEDEVALALESRLAGDLAKDREVLYALAARGGLEATRALIEYLGRSKQAGAVPPYILQTLKLEDHPEAAAVIAEALKTTENPDVLTALIGMSGKPGASAFTSALIDLDHDSRNAAVRTRALQALAKIGDEPGVDYLLRRADEPGQFGEAAIHALKSMYQANEGARSKLTKALDTAGLNPRPDAMKESLVKALGALKHRPALPGIARLLDDPSDKVKKASVDALGYMGSIARAQVNRLRGHYDSGDVEMRVKVAIAFGNIGGDTAIAAMERWLEAKKGLTPSLERTLRMGVRAAKDERERAKQRNRRNNSVVVDNGARSDPGK